MTDPAAPGGTSLALPQQDSKLVGLPERFQPRNLTELMAWAKLMVSSCLTPKDMNEAGVILAVQMGSEVNVTPTQALQGICVINGRPSIWGDLGKALFLRDAAYQKFEDKDPAIAKKDGFGWCKITMKNGRVVERTFSVEDAKAAKSYERAGGKGPWITHEGVMLQWRAIWRAMRDADPGVFKGLAAREEQEDIQPAEFQVHGAEPRMPKPVAEGLDPAAVEKFAKEQKPAAGGGGGGGSHSAPSIDRSKLQKVIVKNSAVKTGNGKTFYAIDVENSSGGEIKTTTFDKNLYDESVRLKGNFALVATKQNGAYTNLLHIEAAAPPADEPPPPDEPGSNG